MGLMTDQCLLPIVGDGTKRPGDNKRRLDDLLMMADGTTGI